MQGQRLFWGRCWIWSLCWGLACATAGLQASERAVLVINADSASSKLIANHYLALRRLPNINVIYLRDIPDTETVSLQVFREKILGPIFAQLQQRKLLGRIDYILYSADFPTAVEVHSDLQQLAKDVKQQAGVEIDRRLYNPTASLNSLTYFAEPVLEKQPAYLLLNANYYYRQPAALLLRQPFAGELQQRYEALTEKLKQEDPVQLREAAEELEQLAAEHPQQLALSYSLARCYGRLGQPSQTATWLTRAVQQGWVFRQQTRADRSFDAVAEDPLVSGIIERMEDEPFDFAPTLPFRSRDRWAPNGMINGTPQQGNRHYLSTVLAVTRNFGSSEREALESLQRTARLDGTRPEGTFYFTDTADVRTRTRAAEFPDTVAALRRLGHPAEIVEDSLPRQKRDVAGLTCGAANLNWVQSGSRFLPGAIADNLTSFGGRLAVKGQTKITDFLKYGAAGAGGTVIEPFAIAAKFPHPRIHVHYARGCTLAEAFYQSVAGPWQLLIVGDGLVQPYAELPSLEVDLQPGTRLQGKVPINLTAGDAGPRVVGVEFWVDGRPVHQQADLTTWTLPTEQLADGYHQLRLVVTGAGRTRPQRRILIPFEVDNQGHRVTLTSAHEDYLDTDTLRLQATSNVGQEILLVHNGRLVDRQPGPRAEFKIEASLLGRGPVQLEAVAVDSPEPQQGAEPGKAVASLPLALRIDGRLNERPRSTEGK